MIAARAEMPLNLQDRTWHCVYGEERLRTTPGYVRSPLPFYLQGWALRRQRTVDSIDWGTAAFCVFRCCSFGCWALQEQWSWEARSAAFHLVSFCTWVFCSSPQSRIQAYLNKMHLHNSLYMYKLSVASPSCVLLSAVIGGLAEHVSFCLLFWTCSWIILVALGKEWETLQGDFRVTWMVFHYSLQDISLSQIFHSGFSTLLCPRQIQRK